MVCCRIRLQSESFNGPCLWRTSSGTAIFPMSWSCAASPSSSSSERRADRESLAALRQRVHGCIDQLGCRDDRRRREQAKLVAAESVRGALWRRYDAEPRTKPVQERVARGVAEAVVVALESVEV